MHSPTRRILVVSVLFVLGSCATTLPPIRPQVTNPKNYVVGNVHEVTTGSSLVRSGLVLSRPIYTPIYKHAPPNNRIAGARPVLAPGQDWIAAYGGENGGFVLTNVGMPGRGIHVFEDGRVGDG